MLRHRRHVPQPRDRCQQQPTVASQKRTGLLLATHEGGGGGKAERRRHGPAHVGITVAEVPAPERQVDKVFAIGGARLYRELMDSPHCSSTYLPEIDKEFESDVFFPEFDTSKFRLVKEEGVPEEPQHEGDITYHFRVYERVKN